MKLDGEDNGNCRVYYRDGRNIYCFQDDGSWGKHEFHFYRCSRDGEPSHEVKAPSDLPWPVGETAVGRDLNAWLAYERDAATLRERLA